MLSVVVLLGGVLGWVPAAVLRRRPPHPALSWSARLVRRLTRTGAGLALAALAGWLHLLQSLAGLQQVPFLVLQLVQLLGALAVLPAAVLVMQSVRAGAGWRSTTAWVLVLLALVGAAWFAVVFRLLAPSVSY